MSEDDAAYGFAIQSHRNRVSMGMPLLWVSHRNIESHRNNVSMGGAITMALP